MSAVLDFPAKPEVRPYIDAFADNGREPQWLREARRRGLDRFASMGFPSRRSESWRYLDLQPLERRPMLPGSQVWSDPGSPPELDDLRLPGGPSCLVLIDGRFAPALSRLDGLPPGVWFGPMAEAVATRPDLLRAIGAADTSGRPFAALNAAFFADGFVLDVAPEVALDRTIEIVHLTTRPIERSLHTRNLVALGEGSRGTIFESFAGNGRYWRNDFTQVLLATSATLRHISLIEESDEAVSLGENDATLSTNASLSSFALLLGGSRVRHEANVRLVGEGAHCRLDGAYLVAGNDEANIVTAVDHAAPGGQTRELIKGVAAGRGHGAFQGKIVVREGAQRTDAHQLSRNLLLGRRAVIDTKPELEIYADDVKCAHGASVGDLDAAALFYLRARGIPEAEARRMLVEGFLKDAVDGVADPAIRDYLLHRLALRLDRLETAE